MIHSFKDRRLEKFFRNGKTTAGIPSEIINAILCRLETLDNVQSERELLSNSLRYERLRMTSNRYSSIRVNSKYR
ncbi:type II toxin-antitoxin system RelE/ParE family toxin, partial [Escherichia coli]